jgi:hypothetical protein
VSDGPAGAYPTNRLSARWMRTPLWHRALLILSAALLVLSLPIANSAAHSKAAHQTRTRFSAPPATAATIDALGCPSTLPCTVQSYIDPVVKSAVLHAFPAAHILAGEHSVGAVPSQVFRYWLIADIGRDAKISLSGQCVPGGAPTSAISNLIGSAHTDLGGNTVYDREYLQAIVPGRPGCSVALYMNGAPAGVPLLDKLRELAAAPALQLRP